MSANAPEAAIAAEFEDLDGFRAALARAPEPDAAAREAAKDRDSTLTKPPGALGRLEDLAIWYCGWRGARPRISAPQVVVFAGNHGVAAQGVSAFPQDVTAQMVANFEAGGAAINQLCLAAGARLDVRALDLERPTADFTREPAMSEEELVAALRVGWQSVDPGADLLAVGEMGIANTTSASAVACALFGGEPGDWTGRGTGVEGEALAAKRRVVAEGVAMHAGKGDGLETLRRLGGRELGAMAGAIAAARSMRVPVVLDGFICTAAAAALEATRAGALDHCVAGHLSAEGAHSALLERLGKEPILGLGLRLGEASGAALAIPALRAALECHSGMASFAEAGVSKN